MSDSDSKCIPRIVMFGSDESDFTPVVFKSFSEVAEYFSDFARWRMAGGFFDLDGVRFRTCVIYDPDGGGSDAD